MDPSKEPDTEAPAIAEREKLQARLLDDGSSTPKKTAKRHNRRATRRRATGMRPTLR